MSKDFHVLNEMNEQDFDPEKYVRDLSHRCVGGQELQRIRRQIQTQAEKTSGTLKKNVYQNYMQFIDTAKEISHLESEMYQLSHLLSEQRLLLASLAETSLPASETVLRMKGPGNGNTESGCDPDPDHDHDKRKCLLQALDKIDGCPLADLLAAPARTLVHHADLVELDPVDNTPIQQLHAYLLSDSFLLAPWLPHCQPVRYKFQVLYELSSLAVVNVRDLGPIKYAFKILAFPDTRLFQCNSASNKKEWLTHFDLLKKAHLSQENALKKKRNSFLLSERPSAARTTSNPFEEASADDDEMSVTTPTAVLQYPEWFLEVSEDLDVLMAQRHFEEALALLTRAHEYIAEEGKGQGDAALLEIERKVQVKRTTFIETLMRELEVNAADKSLQGGLRTARRAIRLLNQLHCSIQSCELFLQLCSNILRTQCKRVKREGSAIIYVKHLSGVVFTNLCYMTAEFLRAFPNSPSCSAAFVVWAGSELNVLTSHLVKQVFVPQTSLSTLTECVLVIRTQCERLCHFGIDLCYQLNGALRNPLSKALRETKEKLQDVVRMRAVDERWTPVNLHSKQKLQRCVQEWAQLGIGTLAEYVTGECWLRLTANTLAFAKLFRTLADDCLRLQTPELLPAVDDVLGSVLQTQLQHVQTAYLDCASINTPDQHRPMQQDKRTFILQNGVFLMDTLVALTENQYEQCVGIQCATLHQLRTQYTFLQSQQPATTSSLTKYSTEEFI